MELWNRLDAGVLECLLEGLVDVPERKFRAIQC
jgi:hypothetical protein